MAARADVEAKGRNNKTALMWAAWDGHTEVVEALLTWRADVDAVDEDGRTALKFAEMGVKNDAAEVLRRHGATC